MSIWDEIKNCFKRCAKMCDCCKKKQPPPSANKVEEAPPSSDKIMPHAPDADFVDIKPVADSDDKPSSD